MTTEDGIKVIATYLTIMCIIVIIPGFIATRKQIKSHEALLIIGIMFLIVALTFTLTIN